MATNPLGAEFICGTCAYYDPSVVPSLCRRRAPTVVANSNNTRSTVWPETTQTLWCGEWGSPQVSPTTQS